MKNDRPKRCICTATDLQPFGECICGSVKSTPLPPAANKIVTHISSPPSVVKFLNDTLGLKNLSELSVIRKRDNRVMFIAEIIEDYVKLLNKNK